MYEEGMHETSRVRTANSCVTQQSRSRNVKGGGMREKKQMSEQCWGRSASLLSAFRQRKNSLAKRSVEEPKALRKIQALRK